MISQRGWEAFNGHRVDRVLVAVNGVPLAYCERVASKNQAARRSDEDRDVLQHPKSHPLARALSTLLSSSLMSWSSTRNLTRTF